MQDIIQIITLILAALAAVFALITFLTRTKKTLKSNDLDLFGRNLRDEIEEGMRAEMRTLRTDLSGTLVQTIQGSAELQVSAQKQVADLQNVRLRELSEQLSKSQYTLSVNLNERLQMLEKRMATGAADSEQKLENIRVTMEKRVSAMQEDNAKRLDEMRKTVDEKLQKTLEEKLQQSFSRVSEQLESVYKGLGEMQTLATGVGDLKKVLSNVKTRGILGEIQLGAILEQILAREQYGENIATVKGSSERVEYAVKLPGDGNEPVWLPIDAKFPADAYSALIEAQDTGDRSLVEASAKLLEQRIRGFAKDIHNKYIHSPETTDFGVMFLPIEGLYAEVVRYGMVEKLQEEFKIVVAGPTTMAALLNSLQMGFKTLAIQKRSSEVWTVLGNVKSEFDTFATALEQAQRHINQAGNDLEKLVITRTRQMQRKLSKVSSFTGEVNEEEETFALPGDLE